MKVDPKSYDAGWDRGRQLAETIVAHAKAAAPRVYEVRSYLAGIEDGFKNGLGGPPAQKGEVTDER